MKKKTKIESKKESQKERSSNGTKKESNRPANKVASFPTNIFEGKFSVNASFNNTIVTISDIRGNSLAWTSSGKLGFKGTRKSTPHAATITIEDGVEKAKMIGIRKMQVFIKGPGPGRDATLKVLGSKREVDVVSISDVTPIPHNGPRPPKKRRV